MKGKIKGLFIWQTDTQLEEDIIQVRNVHRFSKKGGGGQPKD